MERRLRLRKNSDFQRVYRRGTASYNRQFTLLCKPNGRNQNRYGFSISKKLGKATKRNLLKRRLREIVRRREAQFPRGYDIVVIPRVEATQLSYGELESSLLHCLSMRERSTGRNGRRSR